MFDQSKISVLIDVTSPVSATDLDEIYHSDPLALPSQSRAWARAIIESGRYRDVSRLYRYADGVQAVLPLFAPRHLPASVAAWRSPPAAWGFGGLISTAPLTADHVRSVFNDCAQLPCAAIQIRPNPLHAATWAEAAHAAGWTAIPREAHVLDLDGGFDQVWNNRFPGKARNRVRRAEKAGVVVESGTGGRLVAEFDALFRCSIQRWARRQNEFGWLANIRAQVRDPKDKFLAMAGTAGSLFRLWVARLDDTPVAAIVVLAGHNAHYTRGAMDEQLVGKSYANTLLHAKAIRDACDSGCGHYHMGETGNSRSLAQFKSGFGAVAVPYAEYRHERLPVLSADTRVRSMVKRLIGFQDA